MNEGHGDAAIGRGENRGRVAGRGKERVWSFAPQAPEGGWRWPKGVPTRQRGRRRETEPGKEQAGDLPRWKEAGTAQSKGRNSRGAETPLKKAKPDRQGVRKAMKSAFPIKSFGASMSSETELQPEG